MRILQVTNLVSHHQLPLARRLREIVGGDNFRFAATCEPDSERERLGWTDDFDDRWILRTAQSVHDKAEFDHWWHGADVVLSGVRDFQAMEERLKRGRLCFYMSERWWKPPIGALRLFSPGFSIMTAKFRRISVLSNFHYLAIGPYAARDIEMVAPTSTNIWQWGYFTSVDDVGNHRDTCVSAKFKVLWVGRMLQWKKVDDLVRAVSALQKEGLPVTLTLIGDGPERGKLQRMAASFLKQDSVSFRDPIPSHDVPNVMAEHDAYVLPSSGYEGWGAVVNEAMACGLPVVASAAAGAPAAIICHGKNGLLFNPGDWRALSQNLRALATNFTLRARLGQSAHQTLHSLWSPEIAADRLVEFSEALLRGFSIPDYETGPLAAWR